MVINEEEEEVEVECCLVFGDLVGFWLGNADLGTTVRSIDFVTTLFVFGCLPVVHVARMKWTVGVWIDQRRIDHKALVRRGRLLCRVEGRGAGRLAPWPLVVQL
ncbi:hypothetical protein T4D_8513 [Trichinella pseudospiralis]|uniref:Uncharacterized protein n=1 Tax=Trichinella pseudospiralis TaxID=6337 RepID=A0A0V1FAK0_TRIPS|nr:hypothetical protein T4D_8513 [Trichinella pseudospiralis]